MIDGRSGFTSGASCFMVALLSLFDWYDWAVWCYLIQCDMSTLGLAATSRHAQDVGAVNHKQHRTQRMSTVLFQQ